MTPHLEVFIYLIHKAKSQGRLSFMVRRIASQVHKQVSRLMRMDYIKDEPIWYQAVLQYPPIPLPPKSPPVREDRQAALQGRHLTPSSKLSPPKNKPATIAYLEDEVRRQFFRDHPFEAFRPISIVEGGVVEEEHPIRGKDWVRLSQRNKNPFPEEYGHTSRVRSIMLTLSLQRRAIRCQPP